MSLTLDENNASYQIKAYTPGKIKINNTTHTNSLILTPQQLWTDWTPQCLSDITADSFKTILEIKPAILLIGTGAVHEFLALEIYGELINAKIGVEVMSTIAACRTFNALAAENRQVAAALLIK